jgi:hypothetical protein
MEATALHAPEEEPSSAVSAAPMEVGQVRELVDVVQVLRDVNDSNETVEDQYSRVRQAGDTARRGDEAAVRAAGEAAVAKVAHRTIQAERPERRASRPGQVLLALVMVALDGVACYFAAQALGGTQSATLVWTALFLAVLGGGEMALDVCRDRNPGLWRPLGIVLGAFVALLGVLRFWFLATVGTGALVPALAGAALFTAATAGFLFLGYRALRAAETVPAWKARLHERSAVRAAGAARAAARRYAAERDRLADAYISQQIRPRLLRALPAGQQVAAERAIRALLSGGG